MNKEQRSECPRCQSRTILRNEKICVDCVNELLEMEAARRKEYMENKELCPICHFGVMNKGEKMCRNCASSTFAPSRKEAKMLNKKTKEWMKEKRILCPRCRDTMIFPSEGICHNCKFEEEQNKKKRITCSKCGALIVHDGDTLCDACKKKYIEMGTKGGYEDNKTPPFHAPDCSLQKIAFPDNSRLWPCTKSACAFFTRTTMRCSLCKE